MKDNDFNSDIEMWAAMCDEMETSGFHPPTHKAQPRPSQYSQDPRGLDPQDAFYGYLNSEDDFSDDQYDDDEDYAAYGQEAMLQEEKVVNPIYPDSVGPDSAGPKPVWVNDKFLKEIESLKDRLFKVENAMARMGQGKKWSEKPIREDNRLMSEIKSLKSRIDRLSDQIGIQEEPTPWKVKRG